MNTYQPTESNEADTPIIAHEVPDSRRLAFLPRHFGRLMLAFEQSVYRFMSSLAPEYSGGYWRAFDLSNGGCYMATTGEPVLLCCENYFSDTVTADTAGIIVCLYALSNLCFAYRNVENFADHFHKLRGFAVQHKDRELIFAAID
jgi:hypothetical protein